MNTNRDASSFLSRQVARAIQIDKNNRDRSIATGAITVPKALTYAYSVLVPANPVEAFQRPAPWLYTPPNISVSVPEPEPTQEIYAYPANCPQVITLPASSLKYTVDGEDYIVSVSSVFDPTHAGHSLVNLFNSNVSDRWASVANDHKNTMYAGLGYYGAWIRVEMPFAIYPTGVRLSARTDAVVYDQRPKDFRVYGTNEAIIGEEGWTLLYEYTDGAWNYSGGLTDAQTKEFSFSSSGQAYYNYLIIMNSNYYTDGGDAINVDPYISLAEYKILGYPA